MLVYLLKVFFGFPQIIKMEVRKDVTNFCAKLIRPEEGMNHLPIRKYETTINAIFKQNAHKITYLCTKKCIYLFLIIFFLFQCTHFAVQHKVLNYALKLKVAHIFAFIAVVELT
jgi:hypothetical protein